MDAKAKKAIKKKEQRRVKRKLEAQERIRSGGGLEPSPPCVSSHVSIFSRGKTKMKTLPIPVMS